MPVYEYVCHVCHHEFEEFKRSMSEADTQGCPSCGEATVTRKMSVFAARQGAARASTDFTPGGCGRCGDPHGPCAM